MYSRNYKLYRISVEAKSYNMSTLIGGFSLLVAASSFDGAVKIAQQIMKENEERVSKAGGENPDYEIISVAIEPNDATLIIQLQPPPPPSDMA